MEHLVRAAINVRPAATNLTDSSVWGRGELHSSAPRPQRHPVLRTNAGTRSTRGDASSDFTLGGLSWPRYMVQPDGGPTGIHTWLRASHG